MTGSPESGEGPDGRELPMTDGEARGREVHGLRVEIDRDLCVGFGDCIDAAPAAFELDGDGIAVFTRPECASREELLEACRSCPVDAITAREEGRVIAP